MDVFPGGDSLLQFEDDDMSNFWDSSAFLQTTFPCVDLAVDAVPNEWVAFGEEACSVVLRDRMITDANLPIRAEHSYCHASSGRSSGKNADNCRSDGTNNTMASIKVEVDDIDDECYPAISMHAATIKTSAGGSSRGSSAGVQWASSWSQSTPVSQSQNHTRGGLKVATTQLANNDTSGGAARRLVVAAQSGLNSSRESSKSPQPASTAITKKPQIRVSCGSGAGGGCGTFIKQHTIVLTPTGVCRSVNTTSSSSIATCSTQSTSTTSAQSVSRQSSMLVSLASAGSEAAANAAPTHQRFSIKLEPVSGFNLPPTPPSSTDSDDGSLVSHVVAPVSPIRAVVQQRSSKMYISSGRSSFRAITPHNSAVASREFGCLILSEEEKRTLLAEGYHIPNRLPLTKSEEKSLKKIRRKIKNKISAQESRRKKKEYMDQMERRLDRLTAEKDEYRTRLEQLDLRSRHLLQRNSQLERHNGQLQEQVRQLQLLLTDSMIETTEEEVSVVDDKSK